MRPVFTKSSGVRKSGIRRGIGFDGETITLRSPCWPIHCGHHGDLFFVHVRDSVVIIGGSAVNLALRRLGDPGAGLVAGLVCAPAAAKVAAEIRKKPRILFMLDLTCSCAFPKP